jgi:hypothetical protein
MTKAKIVFIYSAISVFIAFALVGALGAFGVVTLSGEATVAAIVGPCLGIVVSVLSAKHLFNDPEAITKLKDEHADEIRALKHKHSDAVAENEKLQQTIAELKAAHAEETKKLKADNVKYISDQANRPRAPRSLGQTLIASGSARTYPAPAKKPSSEQAGGDQPPERPESKDGL